MRIKTMITATACVIALLATFTIIDLVNPRTSPEDSAPAKACIAHGGVPIIEAWEVERCDFPPRGN